MALASGWRREDAVVSQATRRLEEWVAGGLWSTPDVEEGTPLLAQAMARLLGARAVMLLVRTPGNAWQPVVLAQASPDQIVVTEFPVEESSLLSLQAPLEAFGNDLEPLLRDNWSPSQANFAQAALALARAELDSAADGQGANLPSSASQAPAEEPAHSEGARASSSSGGTQAIAFDGRELSAGSAGFAGVLDSNNSVSDWARSIRDGDAWQSEMPSLLLPLPSSQDEDAEDGVGSRACGVVVAWIEGEDGRLSDEWRPLWSACASQAGAWLEGALRFERVGRSYRDLTQLTARVVDARDAARVGHGPLVAHACVLMAQALGLGAREAEEWEMAGLLHGIGRVPIPDSLLQKQGSLSPQEREAIRTSMQAGSQWLSEVEGWSTVARLVRHAGERWDGRGYPDGLEGEAIPLGSRALAIAMRFASLSQARPDRGALGSLHNVGAALESEAERALDPSLTTLFLGALRGGARG